MKPSLPDELTCLLNVQRGYFDRSTGVIALEALSQMKFENGIPLAHYNRGEADLGSEKHLIRMLIDCSCNRWTIG